MSETVIRAEFSFGPDATDLERAIGAFEAHAAFEDLLRSQGITGTLRRTFDGPDLNAQPIFDALVAAYEKGRRAPARSEEGEEARDLQRNDAEIAARLIGELASTPIDWKARAAADAAEDAAIARASAPTPTREAVSLDDCVTSFCCASLDFDDTKRPEGESHMDYSLAKQRACIEAVRLRCLRTPPVAPSEFVALLAKLEPQRLHERANQIRRDLDWEGGDGPEQCMPRHKAIAHAANEVRKELLAALEPVSAIDAGGAKP